MTSDQRIENFERGVILLVILFIISTLLSYKAHSQIILTNTEYGDTVLLFTQDQSYFILKELQEKTLLEKELNNYYRLERGYLKNQYIIDSLLLTKDNRINNLETTNRLISDRLDSCEDTQGDAARDISIYREEIKSKNKEIAKLKLWSRVRNLVEISIVAIIAYLSF